MKKRIFTTLLITLFFLLSACGSQDAVSTSDGTPENTFQALVTETVGGESEAATAATGEKPAQETEAAPVATAVPNDSKTPSNSDSNLTVDLGFRPEVDGFRFENYGKDSGAENLTAAELQRMFGDEVCASLKDGKCVLTPPAEQWMEETNAEMSGGHCEGMAALSLLLFNGQVQESQFGGSKGVELPFVSQLQREIAYWWTTQAVAPTVSSLIKETPAEILQKLLSMQRGGETYTIGIYKRDGSGGHAITPFGVVDRGDGQFAVLVYDNNYPGQTRELLIDTRANTWQYEASINPAVESELYEGDAETKTLDLTPTSARLGKQVCPFCSGNQSSQTGNTHGLAMAAIRYNEIFLEGEGHLLIVDDQGRRLGYYDGKFINEIPDAQMISMRTGNPLKDDPEPIYWLPQGINATIQLDGSLLSNESPSDLILVGPGYSFGLEGIVLEPKEVDSVYFAPGDGWLTYETDRNQSPNIVIGIERPAADFYFDVQGVDMQGGGMINAKLDVKSGELIINAEKLTNQGLFNLTLTRIDDEAENEFYADNLVLKAGSILYIDFAEWKGDGSGLKIGVDLNGDGEIDETYEAEDK